MKTCTNCGASVSDNAVFCPQCGAKLDGASEIHQDTHSGASQGAAPGGPTFSETGPNYQSTNYSAQNYQGQYRQPMIDIYDHTQEFDPRDISENKPYCMLVYLASWLGIIVALLASAANKSAYVNFHVRQAIKFTIVDTLSLIVIVLFVWTIVIPIVGVIWLIFLLVLKIIAFVQICEGKAKEPFLIRSLPFLR